MLAYWVLFSTPAIATMFERRGRPLGNRGERTLFVLMALTVGLMVGLRYRVGGDWRGYLGHFAEASNLDFLDIATAGDPGYVLLNWLVANLGGDVWLVNLACGAIFASGLLSFARAQPRPWLALAIAVPYLVIVVAMGYTRQGVAIGLAMHGLVALGSQRSTAKFVLWVVLAACFHKSAVLLIPIAALAENRGRLWSACWIGAATVIAYATLLQSSVDRLVTGYVDSGYDSSGAEIRVAMNALPALILIATRNRFLFRAHERSMWLILAWLSLALVPALVLSPSSTAVDRLGLYLIPLQLMVLSRVPDTFGKTTEAARNLSGLVVIYSAVTLFVWLNYASHALYWLPYRMYPQ